MSLLLIALAANAAVDAQQAQSAWRAIPLVSLLREAILSIHFSDPLTGWAGGERGLLVRTSDGGITWQRVARAPDDDIEFIHFTDRDNGWMIGRRRSTEGGAETVLYRTANGGRTWDRQEQQGLVRLHFRNQREGWAVGRGAMLLRTADGGAIWQQATEFERLIGRQIDTLPHNFGFSDIFFLDQRQGWAVGNFYGRRRDHVGGLFSTSDGGATWRRIALPLSALAGQSRFLPGRLRAVRFSDRQQGILLGEAGEEGRGTLFIMATRDGGRHWQVFIRQDLTPLAIHFYQPARGWWVSALRRGRADEGESLEMAVIKVDSGTMSWQREFELRGERARALYFPSPAGGWAVGESGLMVRFEARKRDP